MRNYTLQRFNQFFRRIFPDGALRRVARSAYRKMNTRRAGGVTGDELAALRRLDDEYREWNERLAREFDLDLSCWDRSR